jgi:hypothetical protein
MAGGTAAGSTAGRHGVTASPAAKLVGFLLLLGAAFGAAHAAGAHLGPVTTGRGQPGIERPGQAPPTGPAMNMGGR